MTFNEPIVNVGIDIAAPARLGGRASVALDVRITSVHLVIGGVIAAVIVWLALRNERPDRAIPERQPAAELRPVNALP